jgi:hypothetical protein
MCLKCLLMPWALLVNTAMIRRMIFVSNISFPLKYLQRWAFTIQNLEIDDGIRPNGNKRTAGLSENGFWIGLDSTLQ